MVNRSSRVRTGGGRRRRGDAMRRRVRCNAPLRGQAEDPLPGLQDLDDRSESRFESPGESDPLCAAHCEPSGVPQTKTWPWLPQFRGRWRACPSLVLLCSFSFLFFLMPSRDTFLAFLPICVHDLSRARPPTRTWRRQRLYSVLGCLCLGGGPHTAPIEVCWDSERMVGRRGFLGFADRRGPHRW